MYDHVLYLNYNHGLYRVHCSWWGCTRCNPRLLTPRMLGGLLTFPLYFYHGLQEGSHDGVLSGVCYLLLGINGGLKYNWLFQKGFFEALLVVDLVVETVNNLREERVY